MTVYKDPETEREPEGEARLLEYIEDITPELEWWLVELNGVGTARAIKKGH